MRSLLTHEAEITARTRAWASGKESLGEDTQTDWRVPCLMVPMGPMEAATLGLSLQQQPVLIVFEAETLVTRDGEGDQYAEVLIAIGGVTYVAVGPQTDYEGYGSIGAHVEVRAVVRNT